MAGGLRPQLAGEEGRRRGGTPLRGYVDDALLPGLYAGAELAAVPSLYEGFGLTAPRGDGQRRAGVGRRRPGALPETCGDAAVLVAPMTARRSRTRGQTVAGAERPRERLRRPAVSERPSSPGAHGPRDQRLTAKS